MRYRIRALVTGWLAGFGDRFAGVCAVEVKLAEDAVAKEVDGFLVTPVQIVLSSGRDHNG